MYKLSKTSKMPGKSWSTPSSECQTGALLSKIKDSVCSKCYAKRGSYMYPAVKTLRQNNYDHYIANPSNFFEEMKTIIQAEYLKTGVAYFRWFDSGDLYSMEMLIDIIRIAYALPHMVFWLPTKELTKLSTVIKDLASRDITIPDNLAIRLSVFMIDADYFTLDSHMKDVLQTRVISKDTTPLESEIVCYGDCISCNYACWDIRKNVAYVKH
jgi:hypothetical protein